MVRAFPSERPRRPWWAAFLAAFLLLGTFDFHPAGEDHALLEALGEVRYSPEAVHPDQPLHLEQATVAERPHCPVCLHRLHGQGAHLSGTAAVAPPALRSLFRSDPDLSAAQASRSPSGARAPPSFS